MHNEYISLTLRKKGNSPILTDVQPLNPVNSVGKEPSV